MRIYKRDAQGDTKFRCTKGQLADTMLLGLLCYANMYDTSVSIHRSAIRDNARDNAFCAKEVDVFFGGKNKKPDTTGVLCLSFWHIYPYPELQQVKHTTTDHPYIPTPSFPDTM